MQRDFEKFADLWVGIFEETRKSKTGDAIADFMGKILVFTFAVVLAATIVYLVFVGSYFSFLNI